METYYFKQLYSGSSWLSDVRLQVATDGTIAELEAGVCAPSGSTVYGPAIPSMPNVHSHAFQRAAAGITEYKNRRGEDFWSWRHTIYTLASVMTPQRMQTIAAFLYLEMVKAGYSAVGEFHYVHHGQGEKAAEMADALFSAAGDVGISMVMLPVLYQWAGFGKQQADAGQHYFTQSLDAFERCRNTLIRAHGADSVGTAFHSLRAVDISDIAMLSQTGLTGPVHIHIAEQQAEVEACVAHTGKRPIELLYDQVDVDRTWSLVHATHANDRELASMAQSGAVVALCPTTEANLGDGIFPAKPYLRQNGSIAIGSDSHVSIDPREELRLLEYGQRLTYRNRCTLAPTMGGHTGERLWQDAAKGGAQSLGLKSGDLAVGNRADLIVLDDDHPVYAGVGYGQIQDTFIFAGQTNTVRHHMIAGRWAVQDYQVKGADSITAAYKALMPVIAQELADA